jgi:DNA-binding transcriptional MerR regulator
MVAGVHRKQNRITMRVMEEARRGAGSDSVWPRIPEKLFFRIGEVSQIVGVEPYVLRYWESEFRGLSPKKSSTGQRMFKRKDVELLIEIKRLLYDQKFTIAGARLALAGKSDQKDVCTIENDRDRLSDLPASKDPLPQIRRELADIVKLLTSA